MKQLFNYAPSLKRVALLFTVWLFLGELLNLLLSLTLLSLKII